jgi:(p)ppGpp synthase/HD superfamily hydrolase
VYQDVLESAKAQVEELLQADEWLYGRVRSVGVTGRTKSIYSTWKKMQRHEYGIERINDLVALRVVLYPEVPEGEEQLAEGDENALCFHVLGKVHSRWTPLPRTLKDYISSPKPNGYRSLHTTVLVGTQPLEVQIRTARMHTVAEYGAAAHWSYKEGPGSASLPWLQIIRDWDDNVEDTNEFVQLVRQELLGTRVFIFSRNGRILNLAKGATLADAASQLTDRPDALRTHQVLVNGAQESAGYELHNGDIVDIDVDAQPLVEEEDASPQARARRYVAEQEEMRLASAADTTGTAPRVWKVCGACLPLPGDTVVGAVDSRQLEGTVHRAGCDCRELTRQLGGGRSLATGEDASVALEQALLDAVSSSTNERGLVSQIVVFCRDRRGMLLDVSTAVTDEAENIIDVHSETLDASGGGEAAFQYSVHVRDAAQLDALQRAVRKVDSVVHVARGNMAEMQRTRGKTAFWSLCRRSEFSRRGGGGA